ncbi:Uncharacterised protein [Enterobacter cloacae]|nr:hypothetical protein CEP65_019135 [Enterobacter hormaechei]PVU48826.1 hypothetical protein CP954_05265 [Enterobacter sp. PN108E5IIB]PVU50019.1 hypothetical protein CP955_16180 [Enterobacter sp. HN503E2II]CZZ43921.1 Uncharacterised protein [Enterobacter cloacae]
MKMRAFFLHIARMRGDSNLVALCETHVGWRCAYPTYKNYSSTIFAYSAVRKSTSVLTDGSKPRLEG